MPINPQPRQPQLLRRQYRWRPNPFKDKMTYPLPILRSKNWGCRRQWKVRQHLKFQWQLSASKHRSPRAVMAKLNRSLYKLRQYLNTQPPLTWD